MSDWQLLLGEGEWEELWQALNPLHPALTHRAQSMYRPLRRFFDDILHTKYRAATDVYALMFLADVVDFIIIIFGFWAFGVSTEPGGHPAAYLLLPPDLCSPGTETLGSHRHHILAVRRPGAGGLPGHAAHPVQHHGH